MQGKHGFLSGRRLLPSSPWDAILTHLVQVGWLSGKGKKESEGGFANVASPVSITENLVATPRLENSFHLAAACRLKLEGIRSRKGKNKGEWVMRDNLQALPHLIKTIRNVGETSHVTITFPKYPR